MPNSTMSIRNVNSECVAVVKDHNDVVLFRTPHIILLTVIIEYIYISNDIFPMEKYFRGGRT